MLYENNTLVIRIGLFICISIDALFIDVWGIGKSWIVYVDGQSPSSWNAEEYQHRSLPFTFRPHTLPFQR
jgi:hypothetical protein